MHIAMIHRDLHSLTRGGICTLYRSLAARLTAQGLTVTLITQETHHPVRLEGVSVLALPRTDLRAAHRQAVTEVLDHCRPDVVECSTWEAEALDYLTRPRNQRAPVLVRGEFSAATLGAPDLAADERHLVHRADRVVAVSRYAALDLADAYRIPTPTVIHNGVDRDRFRPGPASTPGSGYLVAIGDDGQATSHRSLPALLAAGHPIPPWSPDPYGRARLLWVGKITPMKGWDLLERAIHRLQDHAAVTVLLGHSRAHCPVTIAPQALTVVHDLDDDDIPGLYRSADWLLSTSRWEGFGLAIAEAMACGTPVLLPKSLGTAPELLAAGGGHTYRDTDHLARLLTERPKPVAGLPQSFDWTVNADTTAIHYRDLIAA